LGGNGRGGEGRGKRERGAGTEGEEGVEQVKKPTQIVVFAEIWLESTPPIENRIGWSSPVQ